MKTGIDTGILPVKERRKQVAMLLSEGYAPVAVQRLLGIPRTTVHRDILALVEGGVVVRQGNSTPAFYTKGTHYGSFCKSEKPELPHLVPPPQKAEFTPPNSHIHNPKKWVNENIRFSGVLNSFIGMENARTIETDKVELIKSYKGGSPGIVVWLKIKDMEKVKVQIAGKTRPGYQFYLPRTFLDNDGTQVQQREEHHERAIRVINEIIRHFNQGDPSPLDAYVGHRENEEIEHPIPDDLLRPGWELRTPEGRVYTDRTISGLESEGMNTALGTKGETLNLQHLTLMPDVEQGKRDISALKHDVEGLKEVSATLLKIAELLIKKVDEPKSEGMFR